jgi:thioester reductase-like protein/acyl carrier protein
MARFDAEVGRRTRAGEEGARERVLVEWMDRRILGNRLQALISTGAPLAHRVSRWLFRIFGRTVINAYGTTETGGLASNGLVAAGAVRVGGGVAFFRAKTAVLTGISRCNVCSCHKVLRAQWRCAAQEVRLIDCPQLGYSTADRPHPRGEVLAHTGRVAGYFQPGCRRADGSFCAASGGSSDSWVTLGGVRYFRTGDIGELTGKGQIRIIDRCKSYFKLSQGVFVSPQLVEEALSCSEHVWQLFVWGASSMSTVVAVVVPRRSSLCDEADGEQRVLGSLREVGLKAGLKAWEIPQKVLLEREPFSEASGTLAAGGGKLCRPALILKYRARLCISGSALYTEHGSTYQPLEVQEGGGLCEGLRAALSEVLPSSVGSQAAAGAAVVAADSSLTALGLDSMAVARLSSRLAEVFGVALPPRTLYSLPTLGDLEAALFGSDAAVRRGAMRTEMIDWNAEVDAAAGELTKELAALQRAETDADTVSPRVNMDRKDTILLTGATGFLGAFLLRALTSDRPSPSSTRVVCVVRAADDAAARARLQGCMAAYRLSVDGSCVHAVAGDLERERLGLSPQCHAELVGRLRCLIHCGARVSSAMPFGALRGTNVAGTRRALALALLGDADFVHVSTLGFVPPGHAESGGVPNAGRLVGLTGYAQSKWVAEQLVRRAAAEHRCRARIVREPGVFPPFARAPVSTEILAYVTPGLVFEILRVGTPRQVRPGVVCGDSSTGASNMKDATSMLLCGLVAEGIVCTDERSPIPRLFNLCTVDYVAAAIVAVGTQMPWEQHEAEFGDAAFHLCAPQCISLSVVCDWLRAAGYELSEVATPTFCARVAKADEEHPLFALKSQLSQPVTRVAAAGGAGAERAAQQFCTVLADRAMAALGIALPPRTMTQRALGLAVADLLTRSGNAALAARASAQSVSGSGNKSIIHSA